MAPASPVLPLRWRRSRRENPSRLRSRCRFFLIVTGNAVRSMHSPTGRAPRIKPAQNQGRNPCQRNLRGRLLFSGGSRGIGKAITTAFAREGAQVVLAAASADNLAAAAKSMVGGPAPMTVAGDLRSLAGCEQLFKAVNEKFKRCDILVNNAGATRGGNFFELPDEAFVDGFALKYFAAVRLSRLFWPLLKASPGSVINIIGAAAKTPGPDFLIGG